MKGGLRKTKLFVALCRIPLKKESAEEADATEVAEEAVREDNCVDQTSNKQSDKSESTDQHDETLAGIAEEATINHITRVPRLSDF